MTELTVKGMARPMTKLKPKKVPKCGICEDQKSAETERLCSFHKKWKKRKWKIKYYC